VLTYDDLATGFDEDSLAAIQRPWGSRMQRVGRKSPAILASARALSSGREAILGPPPIPAHSNSQPVSYDTTA
jgi:hypothetical protein